MKFRYFWPLFVATALALWAVYGECAEPVWFSYTPSRSVDTNGIYTELMSRCPEYGLSQIRSFDKATQCHEATHFVNYEISSQRGQDYGAFYVGGGKCVILSQPKVTVGQVARYVPQTNRTGRFDLYLTGDRVGRNCLSLLDEATCYANDAQCTKELGLRDDGGLKFAGEFCGFLDCVVQAVKNHDPNYSQLSELESFVAFQKKRVAKLGGMQ